MTMTTIGIPAAVVVDVWIGRVVVDNIVVVTGLVGTVMVRMGVLVVVTGIVVMGVVSGARER